MRYWSSDVCSSDLVRVAAADLADRHRDLPGPHPAAAPDPAPLARECGATRGPVIALGQSDPVRSRSAYFWILPVEVFGRSPNTTVFGTLKRARLSRHQAIPSSGVNAAPGFTVLKA